MVFRGCMNSTCEQHHKKEKKRKEEKITQRPACLNVQNSQQFH